MLIVRGEVGCHPVQTFLTPGQLNTALAEPPTDAQLQAMLVGSMVGSQVPRVDRTCQAAPRVDAHRATAEPLPLFPVVAC